MGLQNKAVVREEWGCIKKQFPEKSSPGVGWGNLRKWILKTEKEVADLFH